MSNAKFHIEIRDNAQAIAKYSKLSLFTGLSLATLAFGASIFALAMAATVLSGGLAAIAITGAAVSAATCLGVFSKKYNQLSAKIIVDRKNNRKPQLSDFTLHLADSARTA